MEWDCKKGGFIVARHNIIRDYEAKLLREVCNDVETEPKLQVVSNEALSRSTDAADNAHPDIRARGFWRTGQNSFFDVRVTNANAASQMASSIESVLKKHEHEKNATYKERVVNIEFGSFTPLVFSVFGSMGPETLKYHKHLAERIAQKRDEQYSHTINFIRCKLSNLAVRSALLCLRGSRGPRRDVINDVTEDFEIANSELRISTYGSLQSFDFIYICFYRNQIALKNAPKKMERLHQKRSKPL